MCGTQLLEEHILLSVNKCWKRTLLKIYNKQVGPNSGNNLDIIYTIYLYGININSTVSCSKEKKEIGCKHLS